MKVTIFLILHYALEKQNAKKKKKIVLALKVLKLLSGTPLVMAPGDMFK